MGNERRVGELYLTIGRDGERGGAFVVIAGAWRLGVICPSSVRVQSWRGRVKYQAPSSLS